MKPTDTESTNSTASPQIFADNTLTRFFVDTINSCHEHGLHQGRIEGFIIGIIVSFFLTSIIMYSLTK